MKSLKNSIYESLRIGINDKPECDYSDIDVLYSIKFLSPNAASSKPVFQVDLIELEKINLEDEKFCSFNGTSIKGWTYKNFTGFYGESKDYLYYENKGYENFYVFLHPSLRDNFKNFVKEMEKCIQTPLDQRDEYYTIDDIFNILGISCPEIKNIKWVNDIDVFKMNISGADTIPILQYIRKHK